MSAKSDSEMGINSWLEDELYQQYLRDRSTVDESWKEVFAEAKTGNGAAVAVPAKSPAPALPVPIDGEDLQPLRGIAGKIAENMEASLGIPLATSQRTIAVKVMDENRRIINQHRTLRPGQCLTRTHRVVVKASKIHPDQPRFPNATGSSSGDAPEINLIGGRGRQDGGRTLMVSTSECGSPNFRST